MILVIQILALACFVLAALGMVPRVGIGWVGMFLWLLSLMLGGLSLHQAH